jgi:pyridoxamine 5'-phosphate oxidase-like protein
MDQQQDLADVARSIIDTNMYMVLGTADETGRPWVSPVYYASAGHKEFFWVSSPEATHSLNVAMRAEVSIVIFDSQVPLGTGQGVYMAAITEEMMGAGLDRGIDIFSRMSQAHGGPPWTREDVLPPAPYRLYRAIASEHSVLDPDSHPNRRTQVTLEG